MIVVCFGTRPEAIKLGPVVHHLRELDAEFTIVCSNQHTDLLRGTPAGNDLWPAHSLGLKSSGNVLKWVERAVGPFKKSFRETGATLVCVQGDTMTALAAARAAHQAGLPIAHIEAGVRSGNLQEPWPEEGFRREITELASLHYAATSQAYANLISEGISIQNIRLSGNPVVSAIRRYADWDGQAIAPQNQILVTMHRREWLEHSDVPAFVNALSETASQYPELVFVWPVHPAVSPKFVSKTWSPNLQMVAPLPYKTAIGFLSQSLGLITDSGGLVEEATTLGIPTVILRKYNDRPEAVEARVAERMDPTPENLPKAVALLASGTLRRQPMPVYGEWGAAQIIASHLLRSDTVSNTLTVARAEEPLSSA